MARVPKTIYMTAVGNNHNNRVKNVLHYFYS